MNNEIWLEHLQSLPVRFFYIEMDAVHTTLSAAEAWGLYRFMLQLADG